MTPLEAVRIAAGAYPKGPEAVATHLGAEVQYAPLSCDGFYVRGPVTTVILINRGRPRTRQRFTLAHEVAHLIYGTKSEVAGQGFEGYDPKSRDERQADALASQLLLPLPSVQTHITTPVVDPATVRKIGNEAKVSERVVALRLVRVAGELGIGVSGVAAVEGSKVAWKVCPRLALDDESLLRFHAAAISSADRTHREGSRSGRVYVASALRNPEYPTLFVQELPRDQAVTPSKAEQLRAAGLAVFAGDDAFRCSLEGKFGAFKRAAMSMTLDQAVAAFVDLHCDKWASDKHAFIFLTKDCRRYIRLKLAQWVTD